MKLVNYIGMVVAITTMGILFKRYQRKYELDPELKGNDLVKKFLLNEEMIYGKPSLWIHISKDLNSRNWESFCARSSVKKNKPYIQVCIESVIKYNDDHFNIFIINDESFSKLLEDWNIVVSNIPDPLKSRARTLGMCKILYKFGGMCLPRSFLSTCKIKNLYLEGVRHNKMFCGEDLNNSTSQINEEFLANNKVMGCMKFCSEMKEYINYLHNLMEKDYTEESKLLGRDRKWLQIECDKYNINLINGRLLGIKDKYNEYVGVEDLLGESLLTFDSNKSGIYLDEDQISSRTKYGWFDKLSKEELFKSNTVIGDKMLLSVAE
jgi:hypothetical protein